MSIISEFFKQKKEDWLFMKLPPSQTPDDIEIKDLKPDEEYLNIILKSMRIVNVRIGFSKFYGAVHSFISVPHKSGLVADFNVITTPGQLAELDKSGLDNVITQNIRLLGPVPYRGGDIKVEMGLFSIKSADLAKPFISLLSEVSDLAGVSFIKAVEPYTKPLETGIDLLLGNKDTSLEIGLSKTYTNSISTGYYVAMRAPANKINTDDLKIESDYTLVNKSGTRISDYPYIVFQIYSEKQRSDWTSIPDIRESYTNLHAEAKKGDKMDDIKAALTHFKKTALLSYDLTSADSSNLVKLVQKEISDVFATTLTASTTVRPIKELHEISLYDHNS